LILFLNILEILLNVAWWILVIQFVLSILIAFNVINTYNDFVASLWNGLRTITEPVYRPIRRILPTTGGIDFSPMVVIILILIIQRAVIPALYRMYIGAPL
jgi:YggT family protein